MIEHPEITHVNRTGHTIEDWKRKTLAKESYMEDVFGREIKIGDNYIVNEDDELIHENSAFDYLCDFYLKNKR